MWRAATRFEFTRSVLFLLGVMLSQATLVLADPAAAPVAASPSMNPYQFILGTVNFFLIAFFVYYVLMLRPQQLKQDEHARFLKDLKRDEEVVTSGGLLGKVTALSPEFITIDVGSGTKLRFTPDHVLPIKQKPPAEKQGKSSVKELAAK